MAAKIEMQGIQLSDIELLAAVTLISGLQMGKTIKTDIIVLSDRGILSNLTAAVG